MRLSLVRKWLMNYLKMFKEILKNKKTHTFFLIFFLIIVASIFRFYNLNWDLGNFFHPDERNIDNAVARIIFFSQLNPQFFAYGGFSIYLYRAAADLTAFITHNSSWTSDWGLLNVIGRFFSALFSTITILPIYFLAKKLSNKKIALLAIALYTFTVTSIQTAHFGVTESLITLIGISICLFSVLLYKKLDLKTAIALAFITGIGIAAKTTTISYLIMPLASYFILLIKRQNKFTTLFFNFFIFAVVCFLVFIILSPYTFLDFGKFMESMNYESGVATGSLPVVYTLQFDHTLPYLFQIKNFFWQMGLNAIFAVLGFIYVLFMTIKKRKPEYIIFSIFPLIYFLYVGSWHTKFIRYMVPLMPFLIISASILLFKIKSRFERIGNLLIMFILITSIIWSLAFFSIYLRPQTRIEASKWIYYNIPYNSKVLNEQWDDGLPVSIGQFNPGLYQITSLAMYDQDGTDKINYLAQNLSASNYIIINSRRLYGTLIHLTDKYPITSKYYKLLFAGKLGYNQAASFTSYPGIFGISINDDSSEETFQVYDHPKVIIFKNVNHFSDEKIRKLLSN